MTHGLTRREQRVGHRAERMGSKKLPRRGDNNSKGAEKKLRKKGRQRNKEGLTSKAHWKRKRKPLRAGRNEKPSLDAWGGREG